MNNKQSGGVVSFVVVTVVLAGLLAGGLYFSKHQARVARESDTTTPVVTNNAKEGEGENKPAQDDASSATENRTNEANKKEDTGVTAPSADSTTTPQSRVAATGPPDEIPTTGPRETSVAVFGTALLVFAASTALRARRRMTRAALR